LVQLGRSRVDSRFWTIDAPGMGYKTIRPEELEQRVGIYWIPSDYDPAGARNTLDGLVRRWKGFVRLTFDDETQVLTSVDYRFENGAYQTIWETKQRPADVLAANQQQPSSQASSTALAPDFDTMWTTYQGWNEYLEYSAATYRAENPKFLAAVYDYDQGPDAAKFQTIWDTYLDESNATELVHIDESILATIREKTPGEQYAFEDARSVIYSELKLSYPKFLEWYRNNRG
jgi:hypothetical protein